MMGTKERTTAVKLKTLTLSALTAIGLSAGAAFAAGEAGEVQTFDFSFKGPFGTYDRNQLQRGLQVYTEVCAACHGLEYVPFRTLSDPDGPALPDDQVRAFAESFQVWDPDLAKLARGRIYRPFSRLEMETAPDLSLMTKARAGFHGPYGLGINQLFKGIGGPEYVASLLLGYTGEEEMQAGSMFYYNSAYDGWLSMNPVLFEGMVTYADGTPATEEQMAKDVAAFLTWTAEPKMMARKRAGLTGAIFLTLLTVLLYLTNKQLWAPVKKRAKEA
jgi:ubiquinol-cytochrome c reductase cytochrome c1 subunit